MQTATSILQLPNFRNYVIARLSISFGVSMLSTAVFKQVFDLTQNELSLGWVGLSEFLPFAAVILYAGYLTDRVNQKYIIQICNIVYMFCAIGLYLLSNQYKSFLQTSNAFPIFAIMFVIGILRGFLSPAQSAFMVRLIPRKFFPEAAVWHTITWHLSSIVAPALAGLLLGIWKSPSFIYLLTAFLALSNVFLLFLIQPIENTEPKAAQNEGIVKSVSEGLRFVFNNQIILGSLALDMFAVLFGGAVAVLPAYASKVLFVDDFGYGLLRAAPAVGALLTGFVMAGKPPRLGAGRKLLYAVAGFGICTLIFAVSSNFWLSLLALAGTGAFDNVSMVIRGSIVPLFTPEEMRGRVSSVNGLFIGSSNELGAFESGVAAWAVGLVPSVVIGGFMTLLVVSITWLKAPKLRDMDLPN